MLLHHYYYPNGDMHTYHLIINNHNFAKISHHHLQIVCDQHGPPGKTRRSLPSPPPPPKIPWKREKSEKNNKICNFLSNLLYVHIADFHKNCRFCCFFHFFRVFKVFLAGGGERGESVVFFQVAHVDRKLFVASSFQILICPYAFL